MRSIIVLLLLELSSIAASPKLIRTFSHPTNHWPTYSSFSSDETVLAVSLRQGEVQVFNTNDGSLLCSLKSPISESSIRWLQFSRDGRFLVLLANYWATDEQINSIHLYRVADLTTESSEPWKSFEPEQIRGDSFSFIGFLNERNLILGKNATTARVSSNGEQYGGQIVVCDTESGKTDSPVVETMYARLQPTKPRKKQQVSYANATLQWRIDDNKLVAHRIYGHKKKYVYHDQMTSIPHVTDEVIIRWADGYATSDITAAARIPLSGTVSPNGKVFAGDWFNLYGKSRKRSDTQHNIIVGRKGDAMFKTVRKIWQPKSAHGATPLHRWTGDSKRLLVGSPYPSRQPKDSRITIHSAPGRLLTAITAPQSKSLGLVDVSANGSYVLATSRRQIAKYKPILELWETGLGRNDEEANRFQPRWFHQSLHFADGRGVGF